MSMDLLNYESNKREFLEIIKSKSVRTVLQQILSLRSGSICAEQRPLKSLEHRKYMDGFFSM